MYILKQRLFGWVGGTKGGLKVLETDAPAQDGQGWPQGPR